MANKSARLLDTGDRFPEMEAPLIDGRDVPLPEFLGPDYGVFLAYRGEW